MEPNRKGQDTLVMVASEEAKTKLSDGGGGEQDKRLPIK